MYSWRIKEFTSSNAGFFIQFQAIVTNASCFCFSRNRDRERSNKTDHASARRLVVSYSSPPISILAIASRYRERDGVTFWTVRAADCEEAVFPTKELASFIQAHSDRSLPTLIGGNIGAEEKKLRSITRR